VKPPEKTFPGKNPLSQKLETKKFFRLRSTPKNFSPGPQNENRKQIVKKRDGEPKSQFPFPKGPII